MTKTPDFHPVMPGFPEDIRICLLLSRNQRNENFIRVCRFHHDRNYTRHLNEIEESVGRKPTSAGTVLMPVREELTSVAL